MSKKAYRYWKIILINSFKNKKYSMKVGSTFLMAVFVLLCILFCRPVMAEPNKPQALRQVLIVHSAYEGYPWTDSLNRGIHDVFSSAPEQIEFAIEYIDTKRNHKKSYFEKLQKLWQYKYRDWRIDLIIVCDNEAYDFILNDRDKLFQNVPLVFAAYIGFKPAMLEGKQFITGVVQETDIKETIDIALELHPKTKKVVFVAPGAPSFRMVWLENLPARYKNRVKLVNITAKNLSVIDHELDSLGPDIIVIPLNSVRDELGTYMPFDKFVSHLSTNRAFPVYALWDIAMDCGVVGGKMVSGELQGREASKLALQILRGIQVSELPVVSTSPNQYMFDWKQLERFNVNLNDLPKNAIVINRPISFYAENRTIVHATIMGFLVLLLFIISLTITIINLKRAQKKLLLSDEILKQMPDAVILTDLNGNILRWLGKSEQIFGYSFPEASRRSISFIHYPEIPVEMVDKRMITLEKIDNFNGENLCIKKDGTIIPIEITATKIFDKFKNPSGIIWIYKDIKFRKQTENALRESEARFKKMIAKSPLPMVITDQNQDMIFLNDKFTQLFGYTVQDVGTAEKWWDTAYPDQKYRKKVQSSWMVAIDHAKKNKCDIAMQIWDLAIKDRTKRTCEFYMVPLGDVGLIIMNDITERNDILADKLKLENKLYKAQKLEALGTFAGGIAHDFNNILYPIIGFTEMSIADLNKAHPIQENLEDILQGAKRARDLVKQILSFSSQSDIDQKVLSLQPLIEESLKLIKAIMPSNIIIEQDFPEKQIHVLANATEIHEIIMNLCTNAYHAMEKKGGILKVCLYEKKPEQKFQLPPGKYCCLGIGDTGSGISPDIMDKIFEPYFTTKEQGKGTGLGLSVLHGIVKSYSGAVDVQSEPDKGTRINIYLPMTSKSQALEEVKSASIQLGSENILFVDDEASIVKLGVRLLERLGYKVVGKTSSIEAVELFKSNPDQFDLVITDMTMPILVGTELAKQILKIRQDIPILICTGFSEQVDEKTANAMGVKGYINKPILAQELSRKVRELLDQKKEA